MLKKGLLLLGLMFLLTSMLNASEAQNILRKAREEYYKSIEGQEKTKKEAEKVEKERIAKEEKAKKDAEKGSKVKTVKDDKKVNEGTKTEYIEEAVIEETVKEEEPKPKTEFEKLEYNSKKALVRVDFYERVVRSVAREEEELKGYKKTIKNKK